jgi:hypothetical protein
VSEGDVRQALQLTGLAEKTFREHPSAHLNLALERVVRARAGLLCRKGDVEKAHDALLDLAATLDRGGVKPRIVAAVTADAEALQPPAAKRRPAPASRKRPRSRK